MSIENFEKYKPLQYDLVGNKQIKYSDVACFHYFHRFLHVNQPMETMRERFTNGGLSINTINEYDECTILFDIYTVEIGNHLPTNNHTYRRNSKLFYTNVLFEATTTDPNLVMTSPTGAYVTHDVDNDAYVSSSLFPSNSNFGFVLSKADPSTNDLGTLVANNFECSVNSFFSTFAEFNILNGIANNSDQGYYMHIHIIPGNYFKRKDGLSNFTKGFLVHQPTYALFDYAYDGGPANLLNGWYVNSPIHDMLTNRYGSIAAGVPGHIINDYLKTWRQDEGSSINFLYQRGAPSIVDDVVSTFGITRESRRSTGWTNFTLYNNEATPTNRMNVLVDSILVGNDERGQEYFDDDTLTKTPLFDDQNLDKLVLATTPTTPPSRNIVSKRIALSLNDVKVEKVIKQYAPGESLEDGVNYVMYRFDYDLVKAKVIEAIGEKKAIYYIFAFDYLGYEANNVNLDSTQMFSRRDDYKFNDSEDLNFWHLRSMFVTGKTTTVNNELQADINENYQYQGLDTNEYVVVADDFKEDEFIGYYLNFNQNTTTYNNYLSKISNDEWINFNLFVHYEE